MTFAAVTKILKVCIAAVILNYSDKREKRKLIYFSERKNNQALKAVHPLQGGSNAKEEYGTRIQDIKSYRCMFERKENAESCPYKNDDRHPYDKRNKDTATKLDLPELEKSDRETGGTMLNVTGINRFYYLRNIHDMRCKYERVLSIHHSPAAEPRAQENEVFIVMSNK